MVFRREPTIEELEERDQRLDTEVSVAQKTAALRALKDRGQSWKPFSNNGRVTGLDFGRVIHWLKTH